MKRHTSIPNGILGPLRPAIVLLLTVWITIGAAVAGTPAMAQSNDPDIEAVTRTVQQLSRAEARHDINYLYDLMVPDARIALPRQALVAWYALDSTFVATGDPVVKSVTFADYEYPVTGEVYENVATATYTQPGAVDGVAEERELTLRLWNDGQGWRWFFAPESEDIAEIAAFANSGAEYASPYRTEAFRQLDAFWAQLFSNASVPYEPPVDMVGVHVQPLETACGVEEDIATMAVYYCTLDETIYYDPGFRDEVIESTSAYAWTTIIAHEWGHHIQNELGIYATYEPELDGGLYAIELELQADCLAGMYTQDALARGLITEQDIRAAVRVTDAAGDVEGTSWDDASAHGTGDQREQSFWTGFDDGFRGCNVDLPPRDGNQTP